MSSLPCNSTYMPTRHLLTIIYIYPSQSDRLFHFYKELNPACGPCQTLLPPTSSKTQWDLISIDVRSGLVCLIRSPLATVTVPYMRDDFPQNSDSHLRNTDVFRKCQTEVISQLEAEIKQRSPFPSYFDSISVQSNISFPCSFPVTSQTPSVSLCNPVLAAQATQQLPLTPCHPWASPPQPSAAICPKAVLPFPPWPKVPSVTTSRPHSRCLPSCGCHCFPIMSHKSPNTNSHPLCKLWCLSALDGLETRPIQIPQRCCHSHSFQGLKMQFPVGEGDRCSALISV